MNYRRVLLIFELSAEPGSAIAAVQRVAPHLEELILLAYAPGPRLPWMAGHTNEAAPLFEQLRHRAAGAAPKVEVKLASALDAGDLASLAAAASIDLLAVAEPKLAMLSAVAEVRKTLSLPLLCIWPAPSSDGPLKEILCVAIGSRAEGAVAAFLRDHGTPELHARVLTPRRPSSDELAIVLDVARIHAQVTLTPAQHPPDAPVDLVVLAQFPGPLLATRSWPAPILVLPPLQRSARPQRAIDVPDLVEDAGVFRARILYASGLGRHAPIPDQEVAFVAGGQVAALVATHKGDAEIRADLAADAVGVYRMAERKDLDPVSAIEERVRLIRPGSRPLILFDAALGARDVSLLAKHDGPEAPELLAVRMRPTRSCRAIRARLRRAGIRPCVIDASAVLDEGAALDVGKAMDVVRLARVVARMRGAAGFPVVAIVHGGAHAPSTAGFAALTADQLGSAAPWPVERRALPRSLEARLAETTGAALLAGNRVEIELDNPTARRWLLEAIRAARRRFHLQVYMAADDDVGSQVESALAGGWLPGGDRARTRRFSPRPGRLFRRSQSPARASPHAARGRASSGAVGHRPSFARGPEAARPSQDRNRRRDARSARRTQSLARVLHRLRRSEAHSAVAVAPGALAGRRRARRGPGCCSPGTLLVDGLVCTVGSANLDITAGYWESEVMLVVEDGSVARKLEEWIDRLIEGSKPFDRNDPVWQQAAGRRVWMRHWPGVLSI